MSKFSSHFVILQIIIEGIRGKGYASDVALDDVKITSGGCPAFDEREFAETSDTKITL